MEQFEREDLRTKLQAIADFERTTTQLRFQMLSLFLAAVGLIVGLAPPSRSVGALLLVIAVGLWVLDLRNRDLLWTSRNAGRAVEERMNELSGGSGGLFVGNITGPISSTRLGFFNWQGRISGRIASYISYQVGIDLIVFGVMGYSVRLLFGHGGWWALTALIPLLLTALAIKSATAD